MDSSDDDDDRFLYGSDSETSPILTKPKNEAQPSKRKLDNEEQESNKKIKLSTATDTERTQQDTPSVDIEESNTDESESDSDFDVEFIISAGPNPSRLDSSTINATEAQISQTTDSISVATETTTAATGGENGMSQAANDTAEAGKEVTAPISNDTLGAIDLDKDGLFDGQPVTEIDPEVLKEKPWRQPGANLSDYFNYGFNESTWMEYLQRQEKTRQEYNPRKILMGLLQLQQQGKLNPTNRVDQMKDNNAINMNVKPQPPMPMPTNMMNPQQNNVQPPMGQAFPPLPMFGGFPFPMPGMMPMNNNNRNQNSNSNTPPANNLQKK